MFFIGRKLMVALAVVVVLVITAMVLFQPSGVASAGFSRGFAATMDNLYHLLLFFTIGIWGAWLGREATVLLPFSALVLLVLGMVAQLSPELASWQPYGLLVLAQIYGVILSVMARRNFLLASIVLGAACFFLGMQYIPLRPDIAPPIYYIIAIVLSGVVMTAIGASVGLGLITFIRALRSRQEQAQNPQQKPGNGKTKRVQRQAPTRVMPRHI
jgi:hydrogenase/urease accessory protein HupE